jgi:hypothetical protein
MIGHILLKKIVGVVVRGLDGLVVLEESRRPLTRVAPKEPIEIFKA